MYIVCMFQHPWPKTDALNFKETGRRKNTCIIRLIYGYLSTNITNYYHFKFVFINQTKIKVSKIYLFLVKNVLFTPVLMLKLKQRFIHYISITCTNLCGKILVHAVYSKTSCKNVETLWWKTSLSYFKSLLVTLMTMIFYC